MRVKESPASRANGYFIQKIKISYRMQEDLTYPEDIQI
jgi:hypothetical protein